ncbi:MAG: ParB/RepB/Spo0J family partition protein [Candidatus Paceibacterota bacterium]|jgi:ParB family chromosome partitioning protein
MTQFYSDSIFWIETEKINPNPFQPRKEFDEARLKDLAESIRQYGVLQPIVVTRKETQKEDGGILVEYELISGERRLRASKMAGIPQIPAVIRSNDESNLMKLELAIIENLQREDLNCVDRAKAFQQLVSEFGFKHTQIALKMGKSREYVSNSLRILALPEHMLLAVSEGKISEGHTRPLLMLTDRKDEQETLFKEIIYKKITVRDAEIIARKIAVERARKKETVFDPEITALEEKFTESLGTRVHIEKGEKGGKITIDFFSNDDVRAILDLLSTKDKRKVDELLNRHIAGIESKKDIENLPKITEDEAPMIDDRSEIEKKEEEESEDLYSVKNFSL